MEDQINEAIKMAKAIANKWTIKNPRYDYEEYFGVCGLSIAKAIKDFDESKGVKFTTFAYQVMHRDIIKRINHDKNYNIRQGESIPTDMMPISLYNKTYRDGEESDILIDKIIGCDSIEIETDVADFIERIVNENTKDRYKCNIDRDIKVLKKIHNRRSLSIRYRKANRYKWSINR